MEGNALYVLILVGLIIVIILVMAVLLIFSISKRRILKEVSEKQIKKLEFQEEMLRNSIETQEKERSRIAQELHDDIGSKLNVVNLNINLLESALTNGNKVDATLDQIRLSLNDSITRIRDLSHGLYPPILEKFGIQSALKSLAIEVNRTGQISLDMDVDHDWGDLDKASELNIYRIIQELISNTIKHAKANTIFVTSSRQEGALKMEYVDDGVGFQDKKALDSGMGMRNIKTRISLLKAKLNIKKNNPSGIHVTFILPK